MRARSTLMLLVALAAAPSHVAAEAPRKSLSIAAAANLKVALEQIIAAFKEKNPGAEVAASYGASGTFFAQIQNGAPFDLFLAADAELPAKVAASGLSSGGAFPYALGKLVVWVPSSSKLNLDREGLKALLDPSVTRLAIGNPAVAPYGVAAKEALSSAGLYDSVKDKLVLGQNIGQAAQFAQSGNAQAAMLPLSLAMAPPLGSEGRYTLVPPSSYKDIEQRGVVLKGTKAPELAKAFAAFLLGRDGRAILEKSGYGLPPAAK
jgi:molybdate transport system substrate-binding protein